MRRVFLFVLAAALVAGCGISTDNSPRDIPANEQGQLGDSADRGGAALGTGRVYLLAPASAGEASLLAPVARTADSARALLEALLSGPNANERNQEYRTAIPSGTRLRSASLQGGTLRVDMTEELLELSGSDLVDALAQIVFTSSELDGVRAVKLLVNGADQQWPAGDGALQSEPLTIYDYPGRVASAQPPYPAVPTPAGGS